MTQRIIQTLKQYVDEEKAIVLPRFFKTGKGEYGEGDKFLGITVPNIRTVTKLYADAPEEVVGELLMNEWHECRMCALLIWVAQYNKGTRAKREEIFNRYLSMTERINNWDLVDLSAPGIVGETLTFDKFYTMDSGKVVVCEEKVVKFLENLGVEVVPETIDTETEEEDEDGNSSQSR